MHPKERKIRGKRVPLGGNSEFIITEMVTKCLGEPCKS